MAYSRIPFPQCILPFSILIIPNFVPVQMKENRRTYPEELFSTPTLGWYSSEFCAMINRIKNFFSFSQGGLVCAVI